MLAAGRRERPPRASTAGSAARRCASCFRPRTPWRRRTPTTGPGSPPCVDSGSCWKATSAWRRMSVPAGKPSAYRRAHPLTRSSAGRRCCAGRRVARRPRHVTQHCPVARDECDGERLQVRLVGQRSVMWFELSGRGEQAGTALRRRGEPMRSAPAAVRPGRVARPSRGPATAAWTSRSAAANAPASCLSSAAASARPARACGLGGQIG